MKEVREIASGNFAGKVSSVIKTKRRAEDKEEAAF